jgi:isoleucyl-tRNA synthetase
MQTFPLIPDSWSRTDLEERWNQLLTLREVTVKALEEARREKIIGHSLDANVTLSTTSDSTLDFLSNYRDFLADFCIVSGFDIKKVDELSPEASPMENFPGSSIHVQKALWPKCVRCWKLHPEVDKHPKFAGVCPRCADVLFKYASS